MSRTSFNRVQSSLFLVVSLIFILGLVMIYGTSSAEVLDHALEKAPYIPIIRQMIFGGIAVALGWFIYRLGYREILALSPYLLSFFTFLLLLVLVPGVGRSANGSTRWLSIAGISIQPSEFVKYLIPLCFIHRYLVALDRQMTFFGLVRILLPLNVPLLLILLEPNNGTVFVIGVTLAAVLFLTQVPFTYWGIPLMTLALLLGVVAYQLPYVNSRIKVFLNPELDLLGRGHQPYQAKIAAGSGGVFGKGPGNSWQKLSYLPEAQNDYIAAIFGEEFGFLGMTLLISLLAVFVLLGMQVAYNSEQIAALYVSGMVTFLIAFQAFINLAVVGGLLPSTGLNLPLFSQGGTSLMANVSGIALLLSAAGGRK